MRSMLRRPGSLAGRAAVSVLALGLAATALPKTASAQFWGGGGWGGGDDGAWGGMWGAPGPADVRQQLAQQGFRTIAPIRRQGAVFVADVIDRGGRRERLIVAAADGQVLQRFLLDGGGPAGVYAPAPRRLPRDSYSQPMNRADRGDLVPPADIPDAPVRRQPPRVPQRDDGGSGYEAYGERDDGPTIEPVRPAQPPVKIVKPQRPRVVDRTPEGTQPEKPVFRKPLDPPTATAAVPPASAKPAGQPASPAVAPASPAPVPAPSTTTRLRDPLAIPGGKEGDVKAPASTASTAPRIIPGVTGAPAVKAAQPAPAASDAEPKKRPADVPAAPLD